MPAPVTIALTPATARTATALLRAGRAWIAEFAWDDLDPDLVDDLTDADVIDGIARHFDGGWAALVAIECAGQLVRPNEA
jgi:hypothetical protein